MWWGLCLLGDHWFCILENARIPPQENSDQNRVIQFFAVWYKIKKKTPKPEGKLLGNFLKCSISVQWFWKTYCCDTSILIICLQPHLLVNFFLLLTYRGEWPSGLRRSNKNRKVPGSKPIRPLVGLRDPSSLLGTQWPSGQIYTKTVISIGLVKLSPWEWPKVGGRTAK